MLEGKAEEKAKPSNPKPSNEDREPVISASLQPGPQPATGEDTEESHTKFAQFIERYRSSASELLMRNDDATLVVCVPVRDPGAAGATLQVIRSLKIAVAERLQLAETSSD